MKLMKTELIFIGVLLYCIFDISILFKNYAIVDKTILYTPLFTCIIAVIRIISVLYRNLLYGYNNSEIVNGYDILYMLSLLIFNTLSISITNKLYPYAFVSFCSSLFFECYMILSLVELYESIFKEYTMISNNYTNVLVFLQRRFNVENESCDNFDKPLWIIPHMKNKKVQDSCLICLELLHDVEYVHVCFSISDNGDYIDVQFIVSNILMQCEKCHCTLHLHCQIACHAKCPICKR